MRTTLPLRLMMASLTALLVLTACGDDEPAAGGRTVELTAADSGTELSLSTGDEVVVTLDSNVTTGFAWQLETEPASEVLDVVGSEYVAPETDLVGAGGQEIWRFVATGEGSTDVVLRYARSSGETSGEPFGFSVVVSAS